LLERLGLLLYRLGCVLAVVAVLLGVSVMTGHLEVLGSPLSPDLAKPLAGMLWVGAALIWLLGRGLRFILSRD
jgi:hypothetical protein